MNFGGSEQNSSLDSAQATSLSDMNCSAAFILSVPARHWARDPDVVILLRRFASTLTPFERLAHWTSKR